MPARTVLSEEAEREEEADRRRLDELDAKLRELRGRREKHLDIVHELSDKQEHLARGRAERQEALEEVHREHRALGAKVIEIRSLRDKARAQATEALGHLREVRAIEGTVERVHPAQIEREMADLEMRQQTRALPLPEENALIDRLRQLRKQLDAAKANAQANQARAERVRLAEEKLRDARAEADRLAVEFEKARADRESKMAGMRSRLEEIGHRVAELRETARQRGRALEQADEISRELFRVDREMGGLIQKGRARRDEARRTLREFSRPRGGRPDAPATADRHAERQLEELMKRGRVQL